MEHRHWQDWVIGVVGCWLIASPFLISFSVGEGMSSISITANFVVCGVIALLIAVSALAAFRPWEEWILVALGVWLIAAPWILGFAASRMALLNAVVCGVVLVGLAGWTLFDDSEAGHA